MNMPLYLGLDSSTQSLSAIVLEVEGTDRRVVFESSLAFDDVLPRYGTKHGVLPQADPAVAVSSPVMWAEALELMIERVVRSGLDTSRLAAIAGSAQQHGSVYVTAGAGQIFAALDPRQPIAPQLPAALARTVSPIWMDSSTSAECEELTKSVGGAETLASHTGSRAFERFTGAQIRKFCKREPAAYAATDRIHLVSSFLASLLVGRHAPLDPGDGSGMNLMDLATRDWWPVAVGAAAPGLDRKLPAIVASATVAGRLSAYWRARYRLPDAKVVVWSGDNPCSLIGTGLVREGIVAASLGTSDTVFGLMGVPRVDRSGTGHVFGSPTGAYMGLTCFKNGSLARERIRDAYGLTWAGFSQALRATPPGNLGRVFLPWFEPEITPAVAAAGVRRYGLDEGDGPGHVRGVAEAQMLALARHSRWMGVDTRTIYATGGASANRDILQVMADVFGADVYQFPVGNSACLGAALRALHADRLDCGLDADWQDVVRGFAEPLASSVVRADPGRHALYREMSAVHAACEAHALGQGPDPAEARASFRSRFPVP